MLFQVRNLTQDTGAIITALRTHDAGAEIKFDLATGQLNVLGQMTSEQALVALRSIGCEADRAPEPRQIHASGGSDCCGSCT